MEIIILFFWSVFVFILVLKQVTVPQLDYIVLFYTEYILPIINVPLFL